MLTKSRRVEAQVPEVVPDPPDTINLAPPLVSKQVFSARANEWQPSVVKDSPTDRYLAANGIPRRYYAEGTVGEANTHATQAAERSVATARALGYIWSRGVRNLCNIYADLRDERLLNFCNQGVTDPLYVTAYRPLITPKDATRLPTTVILSDALINAEAILLIDVYDTLFERPAPFSPDTIAPILAGLPQPYGPTKMFWVGRKFYGDADVVHEGAWVRLPHQGTDRIFYRPSLVEGVEYENDPCDWLWQSTSAPIVINGTPALLSWTIAKPVGTMFIISFSVTLGQLVFNPRPQFDFQLNLLTIEMPASHAMAQTIVPWSNWIPQSIRNLLPLHQKIKIFRPVYEAVMIQLAAKRFSATTFTRCSNALIAALELPHVQQFHRAFPDYDPRHNLDGVTWGLMLEGLVEKRNRSVVATGLNNRIMAQFNEAQTNIGVQPSPVSLSIPVKWLVTGAVVLFLVRWWYRRTSLPKPLLASLSNAILSIFDPKGTATPQIRFLTYYLDCAIVAPLWEEAIKRMLTPFGLVWLLPVIELVVGLVPPQNQNIQNLVTRGFLLWLHLQWAKMPYWQGVLAHGIWNAVMVLLFVVMTGRSPQDPLPVGSVLSTLNFVFNKSVGFVSRTSGVWVAISTVIYCFVVHNMYQKSWTGHFSGVVADTRYEMWKNQYYYGTQQDRVVDREPPIFIAPIVDPRVPESDYDGPVVQGDATFFKTLGEFPLDVYRPPSYFYHIMPTCVPGYVPRVSYTNLRAAVVTRLLQNPVMVPKLQKQAWAMVTKVHSQFILRSLGAHRQYIDEDWESIVDEWLDHFRDTKKKKFYARIVQQVRSGYLELEAPKTTDVFVKHDELLLQQREGLYWFKPRIISNVPSLAQVIVGPYVYIVQKSISVLWNVYQPAILHEALNCYFHFVYAGACSDANLSDWMNKVVGRDYVPVGSTGFCIIVSGDDSVVAHCKPHSIDFYEGDASKFDSTQSHGPLKWQQRVMEYMGMPNQVADILYSLCSNNMAARPKRKDYDQAIFTILCSARPTRPTGGADTSIGNTIVMISSWFFVILNLLGNQLEFSQENMAAKFLALGLEMKLRIHGNAAQPTFLKGIWYPLDSGYIWGPLPSRFLKMGKCLRDPRGLYPGVSGTKAGALYLRDVANSYKPFLQVPVIRAFVRRFSTSHRVCGHRVAQINPHTGGFSVGTYELLSMTPQSMEPILEHYEMDLSELIELERMIIRAPLFSLLSHPGFVKLSRDYA